MHGIMHPVANGGVDEGRPPVRPAPVVFVDVSEHVKLGTDALTDGGEQLGASHHLMTTRDLVPDTQGGTVSQEDVDTRVAGVRRRGSARGGE